MVLCLLQYEAIKADIRKDGHQWEVTLGKEALEQFKFSQEKIGRIKQTTALKEYLFFRDLTSTRNNDKKLLLAHEESVSLILIH